MTAEQSKKITFSELKEEAIRHTTELAQQLLLSKNTMTNMAHTTLTTNEDIFIVTPITHKPTIWWGYVWRWWYSLKMTITRPFRLWKIRRSMNRNKPKLIIPKR